MRPSGGPYFRLRDQEKLFLQNKAINVLIYGQSYNLFDSRQKFIWFEKIFIRFKDNLFESNNFYLIKINHFFNSKKDFQTNHFLWFNQIFFLSGIFKVNVVQVKNGYIIRTSLWYVIHEITFQSIKQLWYTIQYENRMIYCSSLHDLEVDI